MNILLVAGGKKPGKELLKKYIDKSQIIIAIDKGLDYLENKEADYIIGDFDSVDTSLLKDIDKRKIIEYPSEKNATDLEIGIDKAIELGAEKVYILGATGNRKDHDITNILLLKKLFKKDIEAYIIDNNNFIGYVFGWRVIKDRGFKYLSIIPLEKTIISLEGVKYGLDNEVVDIGASLTVSNEIEGQYAIVETDKFALFMQTDRIKK